MCIPWDEEDDDQDLADAYPEWSGAMPTRGSHIEVYDGRDGSLEQTDVDREFSRGTEWEDA